MSEDDRSWMPMGFAEPAAVFEGPTQNARVWTEGWVAANLYCPSCGAPRLNRFAANSPVADFGCGACGEEYELKAQKSRLGNKLVDGAYGAMQARLAADNNPNLLAMRYDYAGRRVSDLIVVPKQFFTPEIIEARRPLGPAARRAGWQGCNILLREVPEAGRITLIEGGVAAPLADVRARWDSTLFLRGRALAARGWLIEVMRCVERIGAVEFTLAEVYAFEPQLARLFPENRNVRPKIRQQLQVLRDAGFLEFLGGGVYRRAA